MQLSACRMGAVPAASHDVQLVESPRQVWQVELHERHSPTPLSSARNWPTAHVDVHVPAEESKLAPATHEVHPVAVPSVHVAHEESHAVQVLLSLNLPVGQASTHLPSSSSGVPLEGQVRHAELCAPEQVEHELWQLEHVACDPTIST